MSTPPTEVLEEILHQCAAAAPEPWYPRAYAQAIGIDRDSLDPFLERLRLGGLIRLTDWQEGRGQGYVLTPAGAQIVHDPAARAHLRSGELLEPRPRYRPAMEEMPAPGVAQPILPVLRPVVTHVLIAANIAVFLWGLYLARQQKIPVDSNLIISEIGGLHGAYLLAGQWWRLITCCFVHIGWIHVGVNMYSLYVIGPTTERMWGHVRYLALYLISGLGGSVSMVIADPNKLGAGASGALWGILVALTAWIFLNRKRLPPRLVSAMRNNLLVVFIINIGISVGVPGISASAHFGGGAIGLVVAVLLHLHQTSQGMLRWLGLVGVLAVPVLCLAAVGVARERDPRWQMVGQQQLGLQADADLRDMNQHVIPEARRLQKEAEKLYDDEAEPVFAMNVKRRDPAEVQKALTALATARPKLGEAIDLVAKAGPYASPDIEKARLAFKESLEEEAKYLELVEQSLQQGEQWKGGKALKEQEERMQEARKRWTDLLQ